MPSTITRPPYDPAIAAVLDAVAATLPPSLTPDMIAAMRAAPSPFATSLDRFDVVRSEHRIPGHLGDEILLTVFTPAGHTGQGPGFFHIHGGGMIMGDSMLGVDAPIGWAIEHGGVATTIEYRLAPEHPDPYPVEDCYAALVWVVDHAAELGIDPDRMIVLGASAGGGLSAGTALLARDRSGPALAGQMLVYPMLDDRDATVSTRQFEGVGVWDRVSNVTGWDALLGARRGGDDVSIYAAPARADDLSGLPPTFIDVASAEVFRDEDVAYASKIWADGGIAELHVWPGGTHGFDLLAKDSGIAKGAVAARDAWIARLLA